MRESRDRNTDSQGTTFMWVEHYGELASPTLDAFRSVGFALTVAILAHGAAYFVAMDRFA